MSDQNTFKALVVDMVDGKTFSEVKYLTLEDLPPEDVLIKVDYSAMNFKEGLGFAGQNSIFRKYPMVPGIDLAGTVIESAASQFKPGDQVILNGWGVGERYWGGYTQMARVKSDFLIPLPSGMNTKKAMALGTAGYTAMLCVMTLEEAGIKPEMSPILVTGAAGGVGSTAIAILNQLGYEIVALTAPGQENFHDFLRELGVKDFVDGPEWAEPAKPLGGQKWKGAIDVVGSKVLARVLSEMDYGGCVASCGLAGGADLSTTVMPFILRGVSLRGVDSVMCPIPRRLQAWQRLVTDMPEAVLEKISRVITLEETPNYAKELLDGKIMGRLIVDVNG